MFILFVIFLLPEVSKEVTHNSDDQINTALSFQQVPLELTENDLSLKKIRDRIVTKNLPISIEFKSTKDLTTISDYNCRTIAYNA